ncbi:hypothetical protein EYF80_033937 [Liparis tanakae]|uniref:Uncharacterized protein n=1 Tax=Liparis tanakae TaxID=230148 RepID=A0A4Z2GR41_9TELE|nr:hypothetical protein EYF80_033937 [Liparis tanakae]
MAKEQGFSTMMSALRPVETSCDSLLILMPLPSSISVCQCMRTEIIGGDRGSAVRRSVLQTQERRFNPETLKPPNSSSNLLRTSLKAQAPGPRHATGHM